MSLVLIPLFIFILFMQINITRLTLSSKDGGKVGRWGGGGGVRYNPLCKFLLFRSSAFVVIRALWVIAMISVVYITGLIVCLSVFALFIRLFSYVFIYLFTYLLICLIICLLADGFTYLSI